MDVKMVNNIFEDTGKLILTEEGLVPVFKKVGTPSLFIQNKDKDFIIYEVISNEGVMTKEQAINTYPELLI